MTSTSEDSVGSPSIFRAPSAPQLLSSAPVASNRQSFSSSPSREVTSTAPSLASKYEGTVPELDEFGNRRLDLADLALVQ